LVSPLPFCGVSLALQGVNGSFKLFQPVFETTFLSGSFYLHGLIIAVDLDGYLVVTEFLLEVIGNIPYYLLNIRCPAARFVCNLTKDKAL